MTGCRNAKSWLSAESSVDDRLRPCKHISLMSPSRIFTVGLSARVRAEREHLEPADALPVTKDVNQRVVLSRLTAGLVSSVCLLLFDRQPLNVQIRSQALIRQTTRFKLQRYFWNFNTPMHAGDVCIWVPLPRRCSVSFVDIIRRMPSSDFIFHIIRRMPSSDFICRWFHFFSGLSVS